MRRSRNHRLRSTSAGPDRSTGNPTETQPPIHPPIQPPTQPALPQREVIDGRHGIHRAGDGPGRGGPCAGAARRGARGDRDLAPRLAGPRGPQTSGGRRAHRCHPGALDVHGGVDHAAVDVLRRVHGRPAYRPRHPLPPPLVQPRGPRGADGTADRRVRHRRGQRHRDGQRPHPARRCEQTQRALLAHHPRRPDERAVRDESGHGRRRRRGLVGAARPDRPAGGRTPAHPPARALGGRAPRRAPGGRRPGAHHAHADEAARAGRLGPAGVLAGRGGQFGSGRRPAGHDGVRP